MISYSYAQFYGEAFCMQLGTLSCLRLAYYGCCPGIESTWLLHSTCCYVHILRVMDVSTSN